MFIWNIQNAVSVNPTGVIIAPFEKEIVRKLVAELLVTVQDIGHPLFELFDRTLTELGQ